MQCAKTIEARPWCIIGWPNRISSEALNSDREPAWPQVWSHIRPGRIFDATGQHERALNEYRQAVRTGDNTHGALDEANDYLQHAEHAIYMAAEPRPALGSAPALSTPTRRVWPNSKARCC
jgi:hypothetical protein